jgi:4-amino-4-deoxy-L-arabinose transferase-like glycosyltransferase
MTVGWILGLAVSFLLWEVGLRISEKAWQALTGMLVGVSVGYLYYIRSKRNSLEEEE